MSHESVRAQAARPIGVFDSGLGGLTVLGAIRRRLPKESTVYLGDTARVPYGPKAAETIRRYALEATDFLIGMGVKAIVVACNTATARALPAVEARAGVPVLGVVEPGGRAAANASPGGRIGVIGTSGTIASRAYNIVIHAHRPDARVFEQACPLFVPLVEEGWTEDPITRLAVERYLAPLLERNIDTLVLACTHYPLLKALLAEVVGPAVALIDSAESTAEALEKLLLDADLSNRTGDSPIARYYVTDEAARFDLLARRLLGEEVEHLEMVSVDSTG
ncbi:MAG: glutamate racemase [Candidatus Palauibacterales bacterium]|nr:glutamate racemase [Candidatus Palauibacterales bacterium]MDP2481956.1 glutamate racemase [Candidatus Palauibacterales bacterium]